MACASSKGSKISGRAFAVAVTYDFPETLESTDDYRMAWKHVMSVALQEGATYHGEHSVAMSIDYLCQKLKEAGYLLQSDVSTEVHTNLGKDIQLNADTHDNDNGQVYRGYLTLGDSISFNKINRINDEINIGISSQILGSDVLLMVDCLGITDEMLVPVFNNSAGIYYWYEETGAHWVITAERLGEGNLLTSLTMTRYDNGHFQNIHITSRDFFVKGVAYEEYFMEEEQIESLIEEAKVWTAQENYLVGHWDVSMVQTADDIVFVDPGVAYFEFYEDSSGIMNIPGTTEGDWPHYWRKLNTEETEDGTVVMFEILPDLYDENGAALYIKYEVADEPATLIDNEATFAMHLNKRLKLN